LFLVERNFAEAIDINSVDARQINEINDDVGVKWLFSFLSADKKRTYCLYEAPSAEYIREAAKRNDAPADVIVQVDSIHEGLSGRINLDPSTLVGVDVG
jgi:hypothetical protein